MELAARSTALAYRLPYSPTVGSATLLGPLGGALFEARLNVVNEAWLRVGLLAGGFGILLDDIAEATAQIGPFVLQIFKFGLGFKVTAMAPTACARGV